jgi:translation initiation factor 2 beta subunit (eIF-2beta)/eIF-5
MLNSINNFPQEIIKLPERDKFLMAVFGLEPVEVQRELAKDKNQRVLFGLAKGTTYVEIIEELLKVGDVFVLLKIIENPNTPLAIIEQLSKHRLMVVNGEAKEKLSEIK